MATSDRSYRRYRVRDDDFDDSGNDALLDTSPETISRKPKCVSFWTCVLVVVSVLVLFLLGFCLGYYVREGLNSFTIESFDCAAKRKDNFNDTRLEDVHDKIMYYLSRDSRRLVSFVSDFGGKDPICHSVEEQRLEKTVEQEFEDYNFDSVDVEEFTTLTTYPDEHKPNHFVVTVNNGVVLSNVSLENSPVSEYKKTNSTSGEPYQKFPYVAYTLGGTAKGKLLYAHYGRESDLLTVKSLDVNGSVLLVRLGKISVAEKLEIAESALVAGILLYWDPADSGADIPTNTSFIPYASAGSDVSRLFTIPTQTISSNMAAQLLGQLDGEKVPSDWSGGFNTSYKFGAATGGIVIELKTYNTKQEVYIRNVVGSLHGYSEPGSYVIMGAPRSSFPGSQSDALSSTAMLLQVARILMTVQTSDQWKPRRGIKLISWGGSEFSNIGMREYIKANSNLLGRRAVAYFDLTELASGNKTVMATVTPALRNLLRMAAKTVPNPLNTEMMILDSWEGQAASSPGMHWSPFSPYSSDLTLHPFLHMLGVPEVHIQFRGTTQHEDDGEAMRNLDKQHHFKFHIAVGRIATLAMLRLVDDYVLPYSIKDYTESLHIGIWQTSESLRECSDGFRDLGPEWSLTEHLSQTATAFNDFIKIYRQKQDVLGVEYVNNVKMLFERIFIRKHFGERFSSQHILYPALLEDGSIEAIQELCRVAKSTTHWDKVDVFQEKLYAALHETLKSLRN